MPDKNLKYMFKDKSLGLFSFVENVNLLAQGLRQNIVITLDETGTKIGYIDPETCEFIHLENLSEILFGDVDLREIIRKIDLLLPLLEYMDIFNKIVDGLLNGIITRSLDCGWFTDPRDIKIDTSIKTPLEYIIELINIINETDINTLIDLVNQHTNQNVVLYDDVIDIKGEE